ncbi:hypothetical protein [Paenibacillus sp. LHD-38]|uniref:hypothetical protein n=1 Tax=Paenibacillus sp. LHD-38 TaxID=3072143 RepID=UPI00280D13A4|nr:hypothetical protein [Paenibacillus sp. LHD-38]MDQ8738316.1 hypothetical protein [Paenibacillus sp. LHD-38]
MVLIREVRETDDFEAIYNLINETFQRFSGDEIAIYDGTGNGLKSKYFDPSSQDKGFIGEEGNRIVAFMGVLPSKATNNGHIECGFLDGYENDNILDKLLIKCTPFIRDRGGNKIFKFTSTKFGQVRNKEITLWEKLGFTSDEYSMVTTILDLRNWKESEEFNVTGIEPAVEMDYEDIKQTLIEDGEDEMAELFQNQYSSTKKPDQVVLTLKDETSGEIAGIAYYRVAIVNKGTNNEFLEANGFGLHIRPQYSLNRKEIRRFLQGCLVSMKQLGLVHVITRITLKNFNVFAAMVSEGFHNEGLEKANIMRLYRSV